MQKKIGIAIVLIIIFVIGCYLVMTRMVKVKVDTQRQGEKPNLKISEDIEVVATRNDEIAENTTWCGTFQLVWNDMINEVIHQEVKFQGETQPLFVDHLNQQDFKEDSISEQYYYKKFGLKTLDLKQEIENGIQQKFNETSDILDAIDWSNNALDSGDANIKRYLFYTMLKRNFTYEKEFTKLEDGKFANQYDNIKYFGIDDSTKNEVREQVEVLYYHSKNDCAVILNTVEGDQVILCKGISKNTFQAIYDEMLAKSDSFTGNRDFQNKDCLKVPELAFQVKKEYQELEKKKFLTAEGEEAEIMKAIQSIQMSMDNKGGAIKSEAAIDLMVKNAMPIVNEDDEPRYFYFDDQYVLFLMECGKHEPYFATSVSDITKFQ